MIFRRDENAHAWTEMAILTYGVCINAAGLTRRQIPGYETIIAVMQYNFVARTFHTPLDPPSFVGHF